MAAAARHCKMGISSRQADYVCKQGGRLGHAGCNNKENQYHITLMLSAATRVGQTAAAAAEVNNTKAAGAISSFVCQTSRSCSCLVVRIIELSLPLDETVTRNKGL